VDVIDPAGLTELATIAPAGSVVECRFYRSLMWAETLAGLPPGSSATGLRRAWLFDFLQHHPSELIHEPAGLDRSRRPLCGSIERPPGERTRFWARCGTA
jgi:hypothetical protein